MKERRYIAKKATNARITAFSLLDMSGLCFEEKQNGSPARVNNNRTTLLVCGIRLESTKKIKISIEIPVRKTLDSVILLFPSFAKLHIVQVLRKNTALTIM
ncbi:hypothetical protein [Desulfobacula sp.]|uniref:hypothetical protein n=1 Tax=Desulfobacula sp. TaxID=2593537 RepID=UPI0025C5C581|nr:hypothetical protein [Desulfobacula sp.]MBC2703068.1 hypothetical protein [Desulfobacula sp.]